ncbi:hypothetical protein LCGC14_0697100 [marine sediment metagenome]|uniref:Uncharacterized protein n=1 Tax=marine sediment metagenome TaxID=412755 RepID=A0A0F9T4V9_9ZZZZ
MTPLQLAEKAIIHLSLPQSYESLCNYALIMIDEKIDYHTGQVCYKNLIYNESPISYFVDHPLLKIKTLKKYEKNFNL